VAEQEGENFVVPEPCSQLRRHLHFRSFMGVSPFQSFLLPFIPLLILHSLPNQISFFHITGMLDTCEASAGTTRTIV
jgi:hypothetical protein